LRGARVRVRRRHPVPAVDPGRGRCAAAPQQRPVRRDDRRRRRPRRPRSRTRLGRPAVRAGLELPVHGGPSRPDPADRRIPSTAAAVATPTFSPARAVPRTARVGTVAKPLPLIIDSDPGLDDALAIGVAVARPEINLLAVTTVGGNADVRHCTTNALRLLNVYGAADVPVAEGAAGALFGSIVRATEIHGEAGIGKTVLPASPAQARP